MPPIIFAHANSFPAGTYTLLLDLLRSRHMRVQALPRFGHDARYPITDNWPHLVQQLADFATAQVQQWGEPAFLVGHSLGGIVSLMAAARHPELARGVLLLDSPVVGGWRAAALRSAKKAKLVPSMSPGKISQKRREHWPDAEHALAHFASKKSFAAWHPQVLRDYIAHGLEARPDGQVQLHFDRMQETAIYNTLPHNLSQWLRQHPLRCPVAFIGARQSKELRQVGLETTLRITQGRTMMLDGSHLFPMEQPHTAAAAIEASLLNLAHITSTAPAQAR